MVGNYACNLMATYEELFEQIDLVIFSTVCLMSGIVDTSRTDTKSFEETMAAVNEGE